MPTRGPSGSNATPPPAASCSGASLCSAQQTRARPTNLSMEETP
jgi:hypothetical protein